MPSTRMFLILVIAVATPLLVAANSVAVMSQSGEFQPRFSRVFAMVRQAEANGATPNELRELVAILNRALELNEEALKLTQSNEAQRRTGLLVQVDQMLDTLEGKASQLEAVASQRTFTNKVLAYVSGGIAAFLGTLAYAYGTSFWRKYRIKRTFQMRIIPK